MAQIQNNPPRARIRPRVRKKGNNREREKLRKGKVQTTTSDAEDAIRSFAKTSSKVVQQAASILEEEIAAGVVAAREVEKQFVNVRKLRAKRPGDVAQRFRRDAHEMVDLMTDMVSLASTILDSLAEQAKAVRVGRRDTRR